MCTVTLANGEAFTSNGRTKALAKETVVMMALTYLAQRDFYAGRDNDVGTVVPEAGAANDVALPPVEGPPIVAAAACKKVGATTGLGSDSNVNKLLETYQRVHQPMPTFSFESSGPAHSVFFACTVELAGGGPWFVGTGSKKAIAKESACTQAMKWILSGDQAVPLSERLQPPSITRRCNDEGKAQELIEEQQQQLSGPHNPPPPQQQQQAPPPQQLVQQPTPQQQQRQQQQQK